MPDRSCAAIILAAGPSSRLGQPKQLLQLNDESLLRRTTRMAIESGCAPVYVVIGSHSGLTARELNELTAIAVINPDWIHGIASSIKCGLNSLLALKPVPSNVMLLVCDQPKLTSDMLCHLIEVHTRSTAPITASQYAGTLGVPAIFSEALYPELKNLEGQHGAKRVISKYLAVVNVVSFPGGAFDIDTPAQILLLRNSEQQ
jgi:molybdenum cofactor cytidylyltransferase